MMKGNTMKKSSCKWLPVLGLLAVSLLFLNGCATLNIAPTPKNAYDDAVNWFNAAWQDYHKVWLVLDEETKFEWVQEYHTKFLEAGNYLELWGTGAVEGASWDDYEDIIDMILIKLLIRE